MRTGEQMAKQIGYVCFLSDEVRKPCGSGGHLWFILFPYPWLLEMVPFRTAQLHFQSTVANLSFLACVCLRQFGIGRPILIESQK